MRMGYPNQFAPWKPQEPVITRMDVVVATPHYRRKGLGQLALNKAAMDACRTADAAILRAMKQSTK